MQGTSKVILGATLIMVVSLAIVLGLILVLLAELYCSLLLRRRRLRVAPPTTHPNSSAVPVVTATHISQSLPSALPRDNNRSAISLSSLYAHGVIRAPRNFLFPTVPCAKDNNVDVVEAKSQSSQLHRVIDIETHESSFSSHRIGLISTPSHPSSPFISASPELSISKVCGQSKLSPAIACNDSSSNGSDHFMYISNPIYDNDAMRPSGGDNTPFETPSSSPSRLETCGSSEEEDEIIASRSLPNTPPLTPMKKLPAEACSVTLRDARSLGNSGSDSNTNNGVSSSSSGSPCTSPSW